MKITELRIGNNLYFASFLEINHTCRVVDLNDKTNLIGVVLNNGTYRCKKEKLQPIRLTEEILLKCGFSKIACFYSSKDETLELTHDFIVWKPNTKKLEIKYLHQLQNLYFALTGEELIIEL